MDPGEFILACIAGAFTTLGVAAIVTLACELFSWVITSNWFNPFDTSLGIVRFVIVVAGVVGFVSIFAFMEDF